MKQKLRAFHTHKFDARGKKEYYFFSTVDMPVVVRLCGMNPRKNFEFLNYGEK